MKYRITLGKSQGDFNEAVIFREFPEQAEGANQNITMRKISSIDSAYLRLKDEMRDQSAYYVKRIEEVPSD